VSSPSASHESAESRPASLDDVGAGLQIQMIGVVARTACATKLFHRFRKQQALTLALGANGDERGRVDVAVRSTDDPCAAEPSRQFGGVNAEKGSRTS